MSRSRRKNPEPIELPLWMERQFDMLAREAMRQQGIQKQDPKYSATHQNIVQNLAHEAYTHSLIPGEN